MRRLMIAVGVVLACGLACTSAPPASNVPAAVVDSGVEQDGGVEDAGVDDAGTTVVDAGPVDGDSDGLADSVEDSVARDYLPFLSVGPGDKCPLSGIIFRARPHPNDSKLIHVTYDRLFERDCGAAGHVGDNEVFAATIDPRKPFPQGLTALKAVAHQGTLCSRTTSCDRCGGSSCTTTMVNNVAVPIVFSSTDKHATYLTTFACSTTCIDSCTQSAVTSVPPMQNAGEPGAPLTTNLSTTGFITAANGWTEAATFDFNPWDATTNFAGAGNVADDLVDPSFLTPACAAP